MKRVKLLAAVLAALMTGALVIGPAALTTAHTRRTTDTDFTSVRVHGHAGRQDGKVFRGRMDVKRFARDGGELVAVGRVMGTMKNASGRVIGEVENKKVRWPLASGAPGPPPLRRERPQTPQPARSSGWSSVRWISICSGCRCI